MPFLAQIMDDIGSGQWEEFVIKKAHQTGASEILNNVIGYYTHWDPSPILMVQPSIDTAERYSKRRITPMYETSPALRELLPPTRTRDSGNTLLMKEFTSGAMLRISGANSPASLASDPIRVVLLDERSRHPHSAGDEGDAGELAKGRAENFWNRVIVEVSTPTDDQCLISESYENSSKGRYHVRCPHCGERHVMGWANVHAPGWKQGQKITECRPEECAYYCPRCDAAWSYRDRVAAVRWGEWIHEHPDHHRRGYHIYGLMSPFRRVERVVRKWIGSYRSPEKLQTFINLELGEQFTREDAGELDPEQLYRQRRERYGEQLPVDVLAVTAGVDVQDDRLVVEIVGWTPDHESYSLSFRELRGDPSNIADDGTWMALDSLLEETYPHASGRRLRVAATCVDSGGHMTDEVYRWCKARQRRHVFAIRGRGGQGVPILPKNPTRENKYRCPVFTIGVDAIKTRLHGMLDEPKPGPRYCHFPVERELWYFEQLTAERALSKWVAGRKRVIWVNPRQARNEGLDCRIYAMAALELRPPPWAALDRSLNGADNAPHRQAHTRRNWVTQWR